MDKTKILVVDDNPTIRKGLSIRLRANGYEVVACRGCHFGYRRSDSGKTRPGAS
jgi:DNA-binding response OmpR family regulator